ncbi:hypothetical protein, partial [Ligilactobacillus equi]|uniref:hypothetical protein n=1 Tax=Ligilactobacillus equi TaxID=137357 RepID=UPI00054D16C4
KRIELGIAKPRHKWTEEENELIRITPVSQTKELAKRLGVTPNALSKRRKKLGLAKIGQWQKLISSRKMPRR